MPAALKIRSELDAVALISLSVMFILLSKVRLEMTTDQVPTGSRLISAIEVEPIMLSLKVKLSTVTVPANELEPATTRSPTVVTPVTSRVDPAVTAPVRVDAPWAVMVPSTSTFSLKLIDDESGAEIVVPENPTPAKIVFPVPLGVIKISSFDLRPMILFPSNFMAGPSWIAPVPLGLRTISALDD